MKEKICGDCDAKLPVTEFRSAGGLRLRPWCKTCEDKRPGRAKAKNHVAEHGFARTYSTAAKRVAKIGADIFAKLGV